MYNRIILFLLLFGTWLVLSGFFKPLFLILGVISCLLAVLISNATSKDDQPRVGILGLMFNLISYSIWLIKEIIVSTIDVTVKMWQIEPDISPKMGWIETPLKTDIGITIFGNSITLTPGTVTVDATSDGKIQVHALNKEGFKSLEKGNMLKRVIDVMGGK